MTTYYHENTTEIIEEIDTTLIDPGINKVYFFGIEPYITYGYDIEDWREPLEYITSRYWKEMEEYDKYEYLWKIGIMDEKRFAQLISL